MPRGPRSREFRVIAGRIGQRSATLVANKKRAREIVDRLERAGMAKEALAKLRAPAGLSIGAQSPAEIAMSVAAEIVSVRASARS